MKGKNTQGIFSTTLAWLLCVLFVVQVANRAVYTHAHIRTDGTIVNHAHPFNKNDDTSPYKKHHHSSAEYVFLEQGKVLFTGITIFFTILLISKKYVFTEILRLQYIEGFIPDFSGRSPPMPSFVKFS